MALKDLRPALRAFLLGDGTISTLVGGARIYPGQVPQGVVLDSIVYTEISSVGDHHSTGPSGLTAPRIQLTAWSKTSDGAHALGLAIKAKLDGYAGVMGTGGAAVTVQGAFFDSWRDLYDDVTKLFGKNSDYFINYNEF